MDRAEKLVLIAENAQRVFDAGLEKGKSEGGFPVVEYFGKTVEELDLKGVTTLAISAVNAQPLLTKLDIPDVKIISSSAISACTKLPHLTFPKSLKRIDSSGITMCTGLTTVTFEGTPESIATNAFVSCFSLKTVNVPWAMGAVANAPWGITSAMINYNYKGD